MLKPGGFLLAFNHSRTFHRMMVAIEDAGFELRDTIMWLYGTGFPKSQQIKDISDDYKGWQTPNLKPAFEPIVVARKPFKGSLLENILKYGVGGINIEECLIEHNEDLSIERIGEKIDTQNTGFGFKNVSRENKGRFPANIIHDGSKEAISGFPNTKQGGDLTKSYKDNAPIYGKYGDKPIFNSYADEGSAARYFYTAKASSKDRDDGLDEFESDTTDDGREKSIDNAYQRGETLRKNIHPTVKPTELMQYLVKLVTPKGGTVLDIFMGSGSTGKATMIENTERKAGYHFIGIDLDEDENGNPLGYCDIAKARIEWGINFRQLENQRIIYNEQGNKTKAKQESLNLFGGNNND